MAPLLSHLVRVDQAAARALATDAMVELRDGYVYADGARIGRLAYYARKRTLSGEWSVTWLKALQFDDRVSAICEVEEGVRRRGGAAPVEGEPTGQAPCRAAHLVKPTMPAATCTSRSEAVVYRRWDGAEPVGQTCRWESSR